MRRRALIGDPEVGITAAVAAWLDAQQLLGTLALGADRDALDLVRRAVREIDIDEDVARHAFGEHAADEVGTEFQRGRPVRGLAGLGRKRLGKRKGRYAQ